MPTIRLTDAAVQRLKTPTDAARVEYWDAANPGFGIRVSRTGARSWVIIKRALRAGVWKQQRVTLGTYPAVSLADARVLARQGQTLAEQGSNPAAVVEDNTTLLPSPNCLILL